MIYITYFIALMVTALAIVSLYPVAVRIGLVDLPGGRKMHEGRVPLIGGIGIFCGITASLLTLSTSLLPYRSLIAAMGLLLFLGILDDFRGLSAKAKLLGQICAALLICLWGNNQLINLGELFGMGALQLGWFALPFSVIAIVGLINATNLIDGIDGLAGSLAFIQFASLLIGCIYVGAVEQSHFLCIILASLIGFLAFNFPFAHKRKQRVFLGDAGSMLLGLLLGWFTIQLSQDAVAVFKPITMVWIAAFPIMDTLACIIRRVLKGKSPLYADKLHFHHLLLRSGYSPRAITLIITSFAIAMAAFGILLDRLDAPEWLMLALILVIFSVYLYAIRHAWLLMKLLKRNVKPPVPG